MHHCPDCGSVCFCDGIREPNPDPQFHEVCVHSFRNESCHVRPATPLEIVGSRDYDYMNYRYDTEVW